ncbi:MAG TPA: hypothetical protein VM869_16180 [Enhygromyxa sp.]|nr:hypothetical protein [Enhygromyxa sp.]
MSTFMELRFHRVGELAHTEAVAAIAAIPSVEVLLDHTRELGWLQRERLLVEEWDCRIVLWIHDNQERVEIAERTTTELDPYRFLDFGGPVKKVPSELGRIIEALDGSYALVDKGWLRFQTRVYERELLDSLRGELLDLAGTYASARLNEDRRTLSGMLEGQIPVVRQVHQHLLRSGLVDRERILVGYA